MRATMVGLETAWGLSIRVLTTLAMRRVLAGLLTYSGAVLTRSKKEGEPRWRSTVA